jgi:hypothetical protein
MDAEAVPIATTVRGRIGGQMLIAGLQAEREQRGPRSKSQRFFGAQIFDDVRFYTVFWQALAQKMVSDRLDSAVQGWTVQHDLPLRNYVGCIQNLVITPGGVFTVSTLRGFGRDVRVSGRSLWLGKHEDKSLLVDAEEEAKLASVALSAATGVEVKVMAVFCWLDIGSVTISIAPVAVRLVHLDSLLDVLTDRPAVIDEADLAIISKAADSPMCWTDVELSPADSAVMLDASTEMLADIEQLHRVRGRWKTGIRLGILLMIAAAALAVYPVAMALTS